jgi:hypothetical protein
MPKACPSCSGKPGGRKTLLKELRIKNSSLALPVQTLFIFGPASKARGKIIHFTQFRTGPRQIQACSPYDYLI